MTRQRFDSQLGEMRQDLVAMASTCEEMLRDALVALEQQDPALIDAVLRADDEVDRIEQELDRHAIRVLALQQPVVASDLRLVTTALKSVTDVERIGDHCVNIAKVGRRMRAEGVLFQPVVDIGRMGKIAASMLHGAVEAFIRQDPERAQAVIEDDDQADVLYQEMRRDLHAHMLEGEPGTAVVRASYLLFVAHYLERICDHCVNIAERVVYAETGESGERGVHQ